MANCTTGTKGIEEILRRVIYYQGGCGVLLTASGEQSVSLDCDNPLPGLITVANMVYSESNGALSSLYGMGTNAELCDSVTLRFAECTDVPSIWTAIMEVLRMNAEGTEASINFMDTEQVVPCLDCTENQTPLLTRILSSFVRKDGQTYVLLATMEESGPAALNCDNSNISLEELVASCLVPLPLECPMWAWRALHI